MFHICKIIKLFVIKPVQKTILLYFSLLIFLWSCSHTGSKIPVSTPLFDSVIVAAEHIYDSGGKLNALYYVRNQHQHAKNLNIEDELNYYTYVNTIYMKDIQDYDKSIELADSMIHLLEKSGQIDNMPIRHIQALNTKADALNAKGLYNEAYKTYFRAKVLANANEYPCSISVFSYNMGMVLYKQQKFTDAAGYFKQSYSEALSCVDNFAYFYRRQEILDNIGLSYGKAGQYDSAIVYYKKCLTYINNNYNKYPHKNTNVYEAAEAVVYGNLADIYQAKGNLDSAVSLLNKSINVNLQKGYTNSDAEIDQIKLANIYLGQNNTTALRQLLNNINAELDTIPNKYVEMQWNNLMYQYLTVQKDSLIACKYAVAYIKQNDSFQAANKLLMASDIAGTMKSLERQHELSLLEKEKEKKDIYLVIVAVIAAMAILVILLILRYSARAAKDVKKFKELNNEISKQKQKLEQLLQELEVRDKDKSRILRSVAHDVMSPISAISALTDILVTEGENLTEEQKEILNLIQEACGNSLSLSNEILEAADTIDPVGMLKEAVNINKLLHSSVELLQIKAALKKQTIVIEKEDANVIALVNKDKIRRVIDNLVGNAIKYSFEQTSIFVALTQDGGDVLITIRDSGIGISEKSKHNVFDMFTESKMYGTSGEKPHGIGLSISLQVARAHGGDIRFESEEGKGTTFYFSFPHQLHP